MKYRILTDADLKRVLSVEKAIDAVERALLAHASGELMAPPRFSVSVDHGALVFTAGAETLHSQTIGFRVYDTFQDSSPGHVQLVAVFDSRTGRFKGLVIGNMLGAIRTAAINAVALKYMARPDAKFLGILGSGFQARFHLRAALAVRPFEQIAVYSPTPEHREAFAAEMEAEVRVPIRVEQSPEDVVRNADVLICATTSRTPVFDAKWLKPGTHINTIGPKFKDAHEISREVARKSEVIVTDSLAQVDAYSRPFFLADTPERERMIELSDVVAGKQAGRLSDSGVTLFCSVGLAGTEVVVANEALKELG